MAIFAVALCGVVASCGGSPRNFGSGGSGAAGTAGTDESGGNAGVTSGGRSAQGGAIGNGGNAGGASGAETSGGSAGDSGNTGGNGGEAGASEPGAVVIATPTLAAGKTYVPYTGTITASGGASYAWTLQSGVLPVGLALQNTTSAAVKIAGTPSEAGLFPISLSVTDGSSTATTTLTLAVTHSVLFLSDRNATGVNELFLTDVGAATATAPTRLNLSFPSGTGITSYAWSPDGSKVLYRAAQTAGGVSELWVASLATPGTPLRVSPAGVAVTDSTWLATGNIAAYSTDAANTYLVDLSGTSPAASQAVTLPTVAGTTALTPGLLYPSPTGKSLLVVNGHTPPQHNTVAYVTAGSGAPTSLTVVPDDPAGNLTALFGPSGRFVLISSAALGPSVFDLSKAAPTGNRLAYTGESSWSSTTDVILDTETVTMAPPNTDLTLRTFTGTTTRNVLVPRTACAAVSQPGPWSPDGKNALFRCGVDLRGISNVMTAAANSDFTLLPSGFLQNAFTDIQNVAWSADSQWLALGADRDTNALYDLFLIRWSVPGTASRPYTTSVAPGIARAVFAPSSKSIAFVGTVSPQTSNGLYLSTLPASGAPSTAALASSASAVVQNDITWLPGSRVILYRAAVAGGTQLFDVAVGADGSVGSATP